MKKILGVAGSKDAHFYEVEVEDLESLCSLLDYNLSCRLDETVTCEFLNKKPYTLGKYQNDIQSGRVKVLQSKIEKIDKKKSKGSNFYDDEDLDIRLGLVNVSLLYPSQIEAVVRNTFGRDNKYLMYQALNLTDLIKVANKICGIRNDFDYDATLDGKIDAVSNPSYLPYLKYQAANKEIWLNDNEGRISSDQFTNIIEVICSHISIRYLGGVNIKYEDDIETEKLKRFAIRNSKIWNMPEFRPLVNMIASVEIDRTKDIRDMNISLPDCLLDGRFPEDIKILAKKQEM